MRDERKENRIKKKIVDNFKSQESKVITI